MTTLVALTAEEYAAFFEAVSATYAAQNVLGGRWREVDALELARSETNRLLPAGIATPDN